MKRVMFVGGGIETIEGIKIAKKKGLFTIVSDGNPNAPCREVADDFLLADVYNPEETVEAVKKYKHKDKINGVITLGCDATLTVAKVSATLGLKGISSKTALLATNKLLMKKRLLAQKIPIPWFSKVNDLKHLRKIIKDNNIPLVLKPVDSRGARGVLYLDAVDDLEWAYNHSISHSKTQQLIVEEWISGEQISTESIIYKNKSILCGTAHREYKSTLYLRPFVIEDGGTTPADLDKKIENKIDEIIHKAAIAVGLNEGTIKGDIVIDKETKEPKIIEVATRLSGGYFCTYNIPIVYGLNFVGISIDIAVGNEPNLPQDRPRPRLYVANKYLFPKPGRIKSIKINKEIISKEWVKLFKIYIKEGDVIPKITDHTKRAGHLMTVGKTKRDALRRLQLVSDSVSIITKPEESGAYQCLNCI